MSEYFKKLAPEATARYQNKIASINCCDPYTFTAKDLDFPLENLPEVHSMDIISYFVFKKSFYTENQIKAFKSLDAYRYYEAGFIQSIKCVKINDNYLVIGEVKHGQRMNDPNLKPWLILLPDGAIDSAHCTCMAGLGEACSHVAVVAFKIHVRDGEGISVTDQLCVWKIPIVKKKIEPQKIKDIDWGKQIKSYKKTKKLQNIPSLEGQGLTDFLKKIEEAESNAVILSVFQPFASTRIPKVLDGLPQPLSRLFDEKYTVSSLEELRNLNVEFEISKDEIVAVMKATMNQSKSDEWYRQRNGRITSSTFKSACTTSLEKPSRTLINCVCYGKKISYKLKPLQYGIENEKYACQAYCEYMQTHHVNFSIKETGLIISANNPIFASSVDALATCDCCGFGSCEFKCPYRMYEFNLSLEQFVNLDNCYIKKSNDGQFYLDKDHQYYFQVQMHMYCTETTYCDFVVWSKQNVYIERIEKDVLFLQDKLKKAMELHSNVIVPELLGKWFTRPRDNLQAVAWCECCCPDNGEPMIKCSNESCLIQWFHVRCVAPNFDNADEIEWICQFCSGKALDPMDWESEE